MWPASQKELPTTGLDYIARLVYHCLLLLIFPMKTLGYTKILALKITVFQFGKMQRLTIMEYYTFLFVSLTFKMALLGGEAGDNSYLRFWLFTSNCSGYKTSCFFSKFKIAVRGFTSHIKILLKLSPAREI